MRFLMFNHRYAPFRGGSELVVQRLAEHLAAGGHDISVITSNAHDLEALWDPGRKRTDAPRSEMLNGVWVQRVEMAYRPGNRILFPLGHRLQGELARISVSAKVQRRLSRRILGFAPFTQAAESVGPPDAVVVTNLGIEGLAIAGVDLATRWGVPYIVIPFLHLGQADDGIARRYASMAHQVELLRGAAAIICMTEMEADFIRNLGIDRPITVAGAGFDHELVVGGDRQGLREELGISGYLVGALGALAADKGTKDTIEAVRILRSEGLDVSAVFAGPTLGEFDRWFSELPVQHRENVHLLGMVSDADRRRILAALDAFVMPSRTESFGIVYLEAWANRCPVIAAEAGAVPELVAHERNGLLTPFGEPRILAQLIRRLMDEPAFAARIAESGYELAYATYTWPAVLERFECGFEQALGYKITDVSRGCE